MNTITNLKSHIKLVVQGSIFEVIGSLIGDDSEIRKTLKSILFFRRQQNLCSNIRARFHNILLDVDERFEKKRQFFIFAKVSLHERPLKHETLISSLLFRNKQAHDVWTAFSCNKYVTCRHRRTHIFFGCQIWRPRISACRLLGIGDKLSQSKSCEESFLHSVKLIMQTN